MNTEQDDETPIDFTQMADEDHGQVARGPNSLNPINYGEIPKKPLPQMSFPKSDSEKADSPYNFGEQENEATTPPPLEVIEDEEGDKLGDELTKKSSGKSSALNSGMNSGCVSGLQSGSRTPAYYQAQIKNYEFKGCVKI